jgi:RND superfamily putative drug exporter
VAVLLSTSLSDEDNAAAVEALREAAQEDLPGGLQAQVTGGPAFRADIGAVFEGADVTLLLATVLVVAVLLLVTYRSPLLWLVPLIVVGLGDRVATVSVGALAPEVGLDLDAAAAGIISVLVFGAGSNYALLLVARYRDELRQQHDRFAAMERALRTTAPAVLASGGTVALSLLTLLAADLTSNRGLGFGGAVGVCIAMAVRARRPAGRAGAPGPLAVLAVRAPRRRPDDGRALRPVVPPRHAGRASPRSRRRGGRRGARRALARALGASTGLAPADSFRETPEAVEGQQTLERGLPGGAAQPLVVVSAAQARTTSPAPRGRWTA